MINGKIPKTAASQNGSGLVKGIGDGFRGVGVRAKGDKLAPQLAVAL